VAEDIIHNKLTKYIYWHFFPLQIGGRRGLEDFFGYWSWDGFGGAGGIRDKGLEEFGMVEGFGFGFGLGVKG
jgi:hypothetical protein